MQYKEITKEKIKNIATLHINNEQNEEERDLIDEGREEEIGDNAEDEDISACSIANEDSSKEGNVYIDLDEFK